MFGRCSLSIPLEAAFDTMAELLGVLADLINVFEVFLPQLLAYPNPSDPLNGEAAALMLRDPEKYKAKIREVDFISNSGHAIKERRVATLV
jgi:hypothetical protein